MVEVNSRQEDMALRTHTVELARLAELAEQAVAMARRIPTAVKATDKA